MVGAVSQARPRSSGRASSKLRVNPASSMTREPPQPGRNVDRLVGVGCSIGLWMMARSRNGSRNATNTCPDPSEHGGKQRPDESVGESDEDVGDCVEDPLCGVEYQRGRCQGDGSGEQGGEGEYAETRGE